MDLMLLSIYVMSKAIDFWLSAIFYQLVLTMSVRIDKKNEYCKESYKLLLAWWSYSQRFAFVLKAFMWRCYWHSIDSKRTLNTQASQASQICEPYLESKFMEYIYLALFSRTLTENIIKCFIGVVYNRIMHKTLLMHMDTSCCET